MIAIGTAAFLIEKIEEGNSSWKKYFRISQGVTIAILMSGAVLLNGWFFPVQQFWIILIGIVFVILLYLPYRHNTEVSGVFWVPSFITILMLNFFLNTNFYPQLANYQAGSTMAEKIDREKIDWNRIYIYDQIYRSFDFYSGRINPQLSDSLVKRRILAGEKFYLLVNEAGKKRISDQGIAFMEHTKTPDMRITMLKLNFLNPSTREGTLKYAYLLEIN